MPNMSYCRFQNTLSDLRDCCDHIGDNLSGDEDQARQRLLEVCASILMAWGYEDDDGNLNVLKYETEAEMRDQFDTGDYDGWDDEEEPA